MRVVAVSGSSRSPASKRHPGRLGQPQAIGLRACSSSMYTMDIRRVKRVPVASVSLLTLRSLTQQPSIIGRCALRLSARLLLLLLLLLAAFMCLREWQQCADISCHHKLTHDLPVVEDD